MRPTRSLHNARAEAPARNDARCNPKLNRFFNAFKPVARPWFIPAANSVANLVEQKGFTARSQWRLTSEAFRALLKIPSDRFALS